MSVEWKRRCMIIGIVAGVYVGYRYILPVAFPFLFAWILSTWIYPIAYKIEKKIKIKRTTAGVLIMFAALSILGFVGYLAVSEVFDQIQTIISDIPALQKRFLGVISTCCGFIEKNLGITADVSRKYILTNIDKMKNGLFSFVTPQNVTKVFGSLKEIIVLISGIVVSFIAALLLLGDMEQIQGKIREYSWLVGTRRVVDRLKKTMVTYLKAQIIIMILVSAVCALGFWFIKNPYFLIFGIVLGMLDTVPLIGTGTILYPAAVVLLIRGNTIGAIVCVVLDIITSLLREWLEPKLLGEKLGISPIVILASVYIGVILFGVWGVLLGPLAYSTIYEFGHEWDVWD